MSILDCVMITAGSIVAAALLTWVVWAMVEWLCPSEETRIQRRLARRTPEEIERDAQEWRDLEARYRYVDILKRPRRASRRPIRRVR